MNVLNNKNIVVTGGNGFLGKVFCEAISENGGNPIILDNNIKIWNYSINTEFFDKKNYEL